MSSLREALQAVHDRRGQLTAPLVVDEWRDPDHPDHDRLEWDDAVGAEKHRIYQARKLIQSIGFVDRKTGTSDPERSVRYWQPVRTERGCEYRPADAVAADPIAREVLLMDMRREWAALKRRYEAFVEFADMILNDLQDGAA